jgi:hypothetical protein
VLITGGGGSNTEYLCVSIYQTESSSLVVCGSTPTVETADIPEGSLN